MTLAPPARPHPANPNSCRWCGIDRREHMRRWKPTVGWHPWEQPTQAQILARMRARRANRPAVLVTTRDRMRAIHADAYTADENPRCATCHTDNCPRYQRIQDRLYQQHLARVALLPADTYTEEPW